LRQEKEFKHVNSRPLLTEKAAKIEKVISVEEHEKKAMVLILQCK